MTTADDEAVAALKARDPDAVRVIVEAWTPAMLRLARMHVDSTAAAEDVVQDAWAVVLRSLDRFEGRSSLRTYVLGVVLNVARRTGERERRTVSFSSAWRDAREDDHAAAVPAERFDGNGGWLSPPTAWSSRPDDLLSAAELRLQVERAIDDLAPRQRAVITARDVLGLSAEEVADLFDVSVGNQRVLLHRARAKVRAMVEAYVNHEPVVFANNKPARPARGGHPIMCRQLVELVDDYLEGRLQADMRSKVEAHLAGCDHCGEYVAQVRRVLDVTAVLAHDVPTAMVDKLLVALRGPSTTASP